MTSFSDDELREMLAARGDRSVVDPGFALDVARRHAETVAPVVRRRWRTGPALAGVGSITVIAVVLLLVVAPLLFGSVPSVEPSVLVSPSQTAAQHTTSPTPPAAAGDRYPGGIPRSIEGEPVLTGLDAQARWQDATDDTPFLVGGWFDSHILDTCSGGIGPPDPNPLAARGCPGHHVDGLPGRVVYPDALEMPTGDGPIVMRIHTRDPRAATCTAVYMDGCWQRTVVESVVWFGDTTTAAEPIGSNDARGRASGVFVMEWRPQPDGSQMAVSEDVFTLPIACPDPWPTLLFAAHGDPRYGLVAVFPDPSARERFQGSTAPEAAVACLGDAIQRPAPARWVGHDNVLVLAYADDAFAASLEAVLADPRREQRANDMTDPALDRSLETVSDYLVARLSGLLGHAWGERLIDPVVGEATETESLDAPWRRDVFRRHAADALDGTIEALDEKLSEGRVGPTAWRVLQDAGVTRARIYRVTYPHATDPALATEDYLVIQMPLSIFRDWQLIRIAGAPYPPAPTPS